MEKWLPFGIGQAAALCWAMKPLEKVLLATGCLLSHGCGVSFCPSVSVALAVSVPAVATEQQTWGALVTLAGFKGGFVLLCRRWGQPGPQPWHTDVAGRAACKYFRSV